jgi:hypothetical protein
MPCIFKLAAYTNCIFKCAESAFKYLHRLMPIDYQLTLDIKRILISNRYYLLLYQFNFKIPDIICIFTKWVKKQ